MDSRPGDETLLLAVAEHDMGAFRTLYERHAGWLAIRLARRCNDRDLVADAIQDTFVAVWQRPRGFRGDGDIAATLPRARRRLTSRRVRERRSRTGRGRPGAAVGGVRRHRPGAGPAVAGDARCHPGRRAGRPVRQGGGAAAARAGEQREDQALPGQGAPAGRPGGGTVMTGWHLDDDMLRRYAGRADSLAEGASAEQHLLSCAPCRARVTAAAGVTGRSVIDF